MPSEVMEKEKGPLGHIELQATLEGHQDRVWLVTWNPKEPTIIASCSGDKTVRLWQRVGNGWKCTHALEGAHSRTIRSVSFSPSGSFIASAGFDSTTAIWEKEFNNQYGCIANLEGHENEVKSVAFSASGSLLATCSRDKSVWIWAVESDGTFECLSVLQEHTQDVKMVVWHPQEDLLASASYDNTIKIWREDEDDWTCVSTLEGHESTVWAVDFNKLGTHLVSASEDKSIRIWHRATVGISYERWECIQTISDCFTRTIYSVSWNKDVPFGPIVTGSADNAIRVFLTPDSDNFLKYGLSATVNSAHGVFDVNAVAWRSDPNAEKLFASGGDDGTVRIWKYSPQQ